MIVWLYSIIDIFTTENWFDIYQRAMMWWLLFMRAKILKKNFFFTFLSFVIFMSNHIQWSFTLSKRDIY